MAYVFRHQRTPATEALRGGRRPRFGAGNDPSRLLASIDSTFALLMRESCDSGARYADASGRSRPRGAWRRTVSSRQARKRFGSDQVEVLVQVWGLAACEIRHSYRAISTARCKHMEHCLPQPRCREAASRQFWIARADRRVPSQREAAGLQKMRRSLAQPAFALVQDPLPSRRTIFVALIMICLTRSWWR